MGWMRTALILSCLIAQILGDPLLIFANRKDVSMVDAGNPHGNATIIIEGLEDAAALDFYFPGKMVFWTDVSLERIQRTFIDGPRKITQVIQTGLISPDGLACDWLGNKLYWTDSETNRIEVSNFDGSYRKVLFWQNLDQPRAIALDPLNGYMYWTDWGEIPKIERAGMDGSPSQRKIIIKENIFWPNGLTIDYTESKLYWADAKLNYIHRCNFDGSGRQPVVVDLLPHPFALTVLGETLFWTDWKTRAIHSCNKETGEGRQVVHENIFSPMDIQAFSQDRQTQGTNPCGPINGNCSHLCLMSPFNPFYKCACPTGVRLLEDGKTCANGAEEILLLARRSDLRRISLDTNDYTDVVLQLTDIKHAIGVDFDPVEGYVYWTDDEVRAIRRAFLNGSGEEHIVTTEVQNPECVAIDWIARNLYWTDTGTDRIEVARLNGTSRKVLISEKLDEPRAIILDPAGGKMYWTDWGSHAKIESANLDGSERKILINTSLGWPNGLALDYHERKLYWCDAEQDKIEMANLDGTNRKILVTEQLPHIFGFSLLGDYIYWTDWQRRSIERVNKKTGGNRTIIIDQLPDLMGLKAVNVRKVEGTNDCAKDNGGCSHLCLNRPKPKGPVCACPMGLELLANKKTCIVPEAFLLFSQHSDIRRISLETTHNDVIIPVSGLKDVIALDFDMTDNRIYWTDTSAKSISRAFMNGSALEHIVQFDVQFPEAMSVDWVADNIYWADVGTDRIEVARLDGSSRKVLVWENLENPRAIALHPNQSHMFWTSWGSKSVIERAAMDGTHRKVVVSNVGRAKSLTIDYAELRIYWVDIDNNVIEGADLVGFERRFKIQQNLPNPYGLTLYQDFLYWTDWERSTIERANKSNGNNRTLIRSRVDLVMDILVFHASRQAGWNFCGVNNGGCEHLCFSNPQEYDESMYTHHCDCPTHYQLNPVDNKTCSPPDSFILFSTRNTINRIVIGAGENSPEMTLPLTGLRNVKAVSYDPQDRLIYWVDGRNKIIKRSYDNGSNAQVFIHNEDQGHSPYDIAIDPYSRNLYWSCTVHNVINVTRLDGTAVGVILQGNGQKPRAIALNPERGYIFWINMANPPRIHRAKIDGTEEIELFRQDLEKPTALTVDHETGKLFWADSEMKRIESGDITGEDRRILVDRQIDSPVSLAVFGKYLYWIDKDQKLIDKIDKYTGSDRGPIQTRITNLMDIHAVKKVTRKDKDMQPCSEDNGGCSHICVPQKDGSRKCSCPIGLGLDSKDTNCIEPPTCAADQFTCHTGGDQPCIPISWRCDGANDCEDATDELDCDTPCGSKEFQCKSGQCLKMSVRCNAKFDCDDRSDEENCCGADQFLCSEGHHCISKKLKCNGVKDCPKDNSDEENCIHSTVTPRQSNIYPNTNPSSSTATTHYTVGIVVGVLAVMIIAILSFFLCRRRYPQNLITEDSRVMIEVKPLTPTSNGTATPPNTFSTSRQKSNTTYESAISSDNCASGPYDRNHLTGASSSNSSVTHFPPETLNPPPSPATDRSMCGDRSICGVDPYCSSASPSTVRSYRFKPRHIPPPPTTPCSTDVCEESEPYPNPTKKYYPLLHSDFTYDSDPYPPPPTPRSHYFSELSCPPSPSTERSFFINPYPPPPSPTATSDC